MWLSPRPRSTVRLLRTSLLHSRKPNDEPDLLLPCSAKPINDYDNPSLFPGMFPTLFPFAVGRIEAERPVKFSFRPEF